MQSWAARVAVSYIRKLQNGQVLAKVDAARR